MYKGSITPGRWNTEDPFDLDAVPVGNSVSKVSHNMLVNTKQKVVEVLLCLLVGDVDVVVPIFWIQFQFEMFANFRADILHVNTEFP